MSEIVNGTVNERRVQKIKHAQSGRPIMNDYIPWNFLDHGITISGGKGPYPVKWRTAENMPRKVETLNASGRMDRPNPSPLAWCP